LIIDCSKNWAPWVALYLYTTLLNLQSSTSNENGVPTEHSRDLIGPAHPISNIRKICLHVPSNETKLHKRYRLLRQDTLNWNHNFWLNHNTEFVKNRDEYTKELLQKRYPNDDTKTTLTADEMSEFYKDFLDRNWSSHIQYNIEWQKRNFTIIFLSILVGIENLAKRK